MRTGYIGKPSPTGLRHPSPAILIHVMLGTIVVAHNAPVLKHDFSVHDVDSRFAATRALARGILQRALDDLQLGGWLREKAIAWLGEERGEADPGSFKWCCALLDINPGAVRRRCGSEFRLPSGRRRDR